LRVCVPAVSNTLDAKMDGRFGRAPWFIIIDPETLTFKAVENTAIKSTSGAGIQAARLVAEEGVGVVISGNMGPNAYQALSAAGIVVMTGASGTVMEVLEQYRAGRLKAASSPTVGGHFGRGMGRGKRS